MNSFAYTRATSADDAITVITECSKFLGGGTNLIDLMKMGVETPERLIDITRLPLAKIEELPDGKGVRLGALARNSDAAEHALIVERYPVLSQALLSGASPQLRNMATIGGNLLQRTRCPYFYDPAFPACNKREPGTGCGALKGFNRMHAILGQSAPEFTVTDHKSDGQTCIAVHPSDMCVALAALDAVVRVQGPKGEREIAITDFHRLPGETPERDTNLEPDELIIAVDLPPQSAHGAYLKVRERDSYAFALVSVAAVLDIKGDGTIQSARIAMGGVAHKPWRAKEAEELLTGQKADEKVFTAAATTALAKARGYEHNNFKIELAKRTIVRALKQLTVS